MHTGPGWRTHTLSLGGECGSYVAGVKATVRLEELRQRALETVRERRCLSKTELASYVRGGKGEVLKAIASLSEDGTIEVQFDGSFTEFFLQWI